ncbi:MAG: nitrite/sulfite reductase, partial [Rhodospirillaceae bacterium]
MYRYDEFDAALIQDRVRDFRDQVDRRLTGAITEDQFKPLRLMNGVYLQLHAYMLRVAVPYGELDSAKMRKLAHIARTYDEGYGHFTTRQNIQYNWIKLADMPKVLEELAEVGMHAIQTSGNCIRNVTSDPIAGVAADEYEDPRPWCELIRQWSTFHPEFTYLPRKFKIAVTGAKTDRAAIRFHDIGLELVPDPKDDSARVFNVWVGGGMGRTPRLARLIFEHLPKEQLLTTLDAILRVYNRFGNRDNKYKARIKILVDSLGVEDFRKEVDIELQAMGHMTADVPPEEIARIEAYFEAPNYVERDGATAALEQDKAANPAFADWITVNGHAHRVPGYAAVTISLKPTGGIPGDASDVQLDLLADLADRYSLGRLVVTHEQNVVFPDVAEDRLLALYNDLITEGLAEANVGHLSDIIACPGLDYCALATARSIPIAQALSERFGDPKRLYDIGRITLNISGCINACGHHH